MYPLLDTILSLFYCSSFIHYIHSAVSLSPLLQVPSPFSFFSPPDQLLLCFPWGMEEKSRPPRDTHLAWPKKIQKTEDKPSYHC